jgi:hypothetical protein
LIKLAEKKNLKSFFIVFKQYNISIDGIQMCFREGSGSHVEENRNLAHRQFVNIYGEVHYILSFGDLNPKEHRYS